MPDEDEDPGAQWSPASWFLPPEPDHERRAVHRDRGRQAAARLWRQVLELLTPEARRQEAQR